MVRGAVDHGGARGGSSRCSVPAEPRSVGVGLSLDHLDGPVAHAVSVETQALPGLTAERAPRLGPLGGPVETPALSAGPPRRDLAPGKRGLKRGLRARPRTVLLMLDETIITEMPPLAYGYGRRGNKWRSRCQAHTPDASCTAR